MPPRARPTTNAPDARAQTGGGRRRRPAGPPPPDIAPIDTSEYLTAPDPDQPPPTQASEDPSVPRLRSVYLDNDIWNRARGVVAAANEGRITGVSKTLGGLFEQALSPLLDEIQRTQNDGRPFTPPIGRLPTGRKA